MTEYGNAPLNIGEFIDTYYPVIDGVVTVVDNYAKRMNSNGNKCTVFTAKEKGYEEVNLPYDVVRCDSIAFKQNIYGVPVPFVDYKFNKAIKDMPLDIIHVHSPAPVGWTGAAKAREKKIPLIVSFHSKFYDHIKKTVKLDALTKIPMKVIMSTYEKADFVWAVSKSSGDVLREYGFKGSYDVVDNGCDMRETVFDDLEKAVFDNAYGIPKDVPVLLFVGQIINHKNIKFSLDAVKLAKDRGFKFKFLLAGTGYNFDEIVEYSKNLGLENEVSFLGSVKDRTLLSKLYSRADLFLFPSTYDNAPIVVMEAASCKTPIIAMKGSTTSEKIVVGKNGFITTDDVNFYADLIMKCCSDMDKLKEIGINAESTIARSFDKVVEEVLCRYKECIDIYNLTKK